MARSGTNDVVYMFAMSLDGFIARPDGSFDWLEAFPADDSFDFPAFEASISGILMGRDSYEVARRQADWAYGRWPVLVATHRALDDAPQGVQAASGVPGDLLAALRQTGADGRIWLFGGASLARQFLDAGLLDTIEIGVIPVILGEGIPAFGAGLPDRWLDLDEAKGLASGALHLRYRLRRTGT